MAAVLGTTEAAGNGGGGAGGGIGGHGGGGSDSTEGCLVDDCMSQIDSFCVELEFRLSASST